MSKIKLSAVAFAAMGMFAGAAQAAPSPLIASSGASATRGTVMSLFVTNLCGATAGQFFKAPTAEGGSNVQAVRCGGAGGKIFSIDTDGGSWRAAAVKNATVFNAAITGADPTVKKARYLDLSSCAATVGGLTSSAAVTCTPTVGVAAKVIGAAAADATLLTAPADVDIGFADTDPAFFDGLAGIDLGTAANLPPASALSTWTKFTGATGGGGTVTAVPALGIVFGVAASRQLIEDLMADQGITVATRPECFNVGGSANLAPAAAEACAPVITKDQYRSITTYSFNSLNGSWDNLFRTAGSTPGPVTVQRRDFGSGTQAVANAYFQGVGCTPYYLVPASPDDSSDIVLNNATGDVLTALSVAGQRSIGVVSRENTPVATPGAGSTNQNWGFLKLATGAEKGAIGGLNGGYPDTAAAARGLYDFWSVGYVFKKSNETNADVNAIVAGLNIPVTDGVFKLANLATGTRGTGTGNPATGTFYAKTGMNAACTGAVAN